MRVFFINSLDIHYLEKRDLIEVPEGVDVIVVNGDISSNLKRSLLWVEELTQANSALPVIYNVGYLELTHDACFRDLFSFLNFRYNSARTGPSNLYFPTSPTEIAGHLFMVTPGFPVVTREEFTGSFLARRANSEHFHELYIDGVKVSSRLAQKLTYEEYELWQRREKLAVKQFDLMKTDLPKVLFMGCEMSHWLRHNLWSGNLPSLTNGKRCYGHAHGDFNVGYFDIVDGEYQPESCCAWKV